MSNFQNARKSASPPKTSAGPPDIYRRQSEGRNGDRFDSGRSCGALRIFLESERLDLEEPSFEWSLNDARKKNRDDAAPVKKDRPSERSRRLGEGRRSRKPEAPLRKKKKSLHNVSESQVTRTSERTAKSSLKSELESDRDSPAMTHPAGIQGATEKPKVRPQSTSPPPKGLFNLRENRDAGKCQAPSVAQPSASTLKTLGGRAPQSNSPSELKITSSEYGKMHINEILKGHAQKVAGNLGNPPQAKDYSLQGVTELLQKANTIPGGGAGKEEKEEGGGGKQKTEDKPETPAKLLKDSGEEKEIRFGEDRETKEKKVANTWMKFPQSNELERRLKDPWQAAPSLPHGKDRKADVLSEEERKWRKNDRAPQDEEEEEKKSEKKATYTDRLLLLRNLSKEKDEKRGGEGPEQAAVRDNPQGPPCGVKMEIVSKSTEALVHSVLNESKPPMIPLPKEIPLASNKEVLSLKDLKPSEGEQFFRTKSTRSTELRDLVTQAVKEHKIFCIFDNHWYIVRPVREELLSRGWLEVIPDRKLIPRRRPPPMGPTFDREKALIERNCNTIEAILAAKEMFADEIQETVSKSSSFKTIPEKPKPLALPIASKKPSEESLNEVLSLFRIIPPTAERKKNNFEIREFVSKYQTLLDKDKEKKGKDKNVKVLKKEKGKSDHKTKLLTPPDPSASKTKSFQDILNAINDNKKTLIQAAFEIKSPEAKKMAGNLGIALDGAVKMQAAIEEKKEVQEAPPPRAAQKPENAPKTFYTDSEAKMISKIIQSTNSRIHFMWLSIKPSIHLKCFNYSPEIVNKFQKTTFCTKIGLWSHLNSIQWYAHEVHFPAKSPRMYNTGEPDDLQAFFQDFQLTACIGMLKWLSDTFFDRGMKAVQTKKGKVPLKAFEFAIKQCEKYIRFKDNEDLGILEEPKVLQEEWNTFLQWFYTITNDHGKLQESSSAQLMVVYTKAIETLKTMKKHWPEIDIDGRLNIWIMKPYCASCGRGIFMTNNVYYIGQHSKYIVQKYIEKPLLIYNTKFDIRQWFLVTKLTPLEIWLYKECYLRFCTQPFALRNLHESVHLSNNSVQRKYVSFRDPGLPDQNMWDSNTFQLYLKTIGHPNTWQDIIYPGMRDAIVSTMLAAQDTFDGPRRSWFEVYGADFMLSANLNEGPWLIEINENPAMDPSTKVTARLCPQMLRDVIKVVVDKRANKNASTGEWELVYRQNYSPSFGSVDLDVRGKKIARVPHATKVGVDAPRSESTSWTNSGWHAFHEDHSNRQHRQYEVVKAYEARKNCLGDLPAGERLQARAARADEKDSFTKACIRSQSYARLKKVELQYQLQCLANPEHGAFTTDEEEQRQQEKQKCVAQTVEVARIEVAGERSGEKSLAGVSSKGGLKGKPSVRETLKKTDLENERVDTKGSFSTNDGLFRFRERKKNSVGQSLTDLPEEKYKFTKFYRV